MSDLYYTDEPKITSNVADYTNQLKVRDAVTFYERRTYLYLDWLERTTASRLTVKGKNAFILRDRYCYLEADKIFDVTTADTGIRYINITKQDNNSEGVLTLSAAIDETTIGSFVVASDGSITESSINYNYGELCRSYAAGDLIRQYPGEKSPEERFSPLKWRNISESYAESFFRTEGGNALPYEGGVQAGSAPNIIGSLPHIGQGNTPQYDGAFYLKNTNNSYFFGSQGNNAQTGFDASRSNAAYGRRNEISPVNQTLRIWRRLGTITGNKTYYLYDINNAYVKDLTLDIDEGGVIGLNENTMTDVEPPEPVEGEVAVFDRESKTWSMKPNTLNMTAYNKQTARGRALVNYDQPTSEETLVSPARLPYPIWNEEMGKWINNPDEEEKENQQQTLILAREKAIEALLADNNDYQVALKSATEKG
jgi:hypothetical protein